MTKLEKKLLGSLVGTAGFILPTLCKACFWVFTSIVDLNGRVKAIELYTPVPKHSLIATKSAMWAKFGWEINLSKGASNESNSEK